MSPTITTREKEQKSGTELANSPVRSSEEELPPTETAGLYQAALEPDNYLYAKRKLKKAVLEYYRLVHSSCCLHFVGAMLCHFKLNVRRKRS